MFFLREFSPSLLEASLLRTETSQKAYKCSWRKVGAAMLLEALQVFVTSSYLLLSPELT